MKIVNSNFISGYEIIESLGLVEGNYIQAVHIGKDLISLFRTIFGGNLKEYEDMMKIARENAKKNMIEEAEKLRADAIIDLRYSGSSIMQSSAEVLCYGTAVKLKGLALENKEC